jgi:hypothetical protein
MPSIYKYITVFSLGLILGLAAMYAFTTRGNDTPMPGLASAPTHTVKVDVPLVVQDKPAARKQGAISKKTEQDPHTEVLAMGVVKGSDGKKTVAALLDTTTGVTGLVENKAFAEFMSRHELGLGYGLFDGDLARAAQYRYTFVRVWKLYATVQVEAFQVERMSDPHPWNAMVFGTLRF